jgi:hypothetical protein
MPGCRSRQRKTPVVNRKKLRCLAQNMRRQDRIPGAIIAGTSELQNALQANDTHR